MHYAVIGLEIWMICGLLGYIAMFLCDMVTGESFCEVHRYVTDDPVFRFVLAIIAAPMAVIGAYHALRDWWDWAHP